MLPKGMATRSSIADGSGRLLKLNSLPRILGFSSVYSVKSISYVQASTSHEEVAMVTLQLAGSTHHSVFPEKLYS